VPNNYCVRNFRKGSLFLILMLLIGLSFHPSLAYGQDVPTSIPEIPTLEFTPIPSETVTQPEIPSETPVIVLADTLTEQSPTDALQITQVVTSTPGATENTVEILVKLEPGMHARVEAAIPDQYMLNLDPILGSIDVAVISVPESEKKEAITNLRKMPGVEFVEGEKAIHALDFIPNDPYVTQQYALTSIHAYGAWDYLPPSEAAPVIAIIDTGIDFGHPEFSGRILSGYDFENEDSNPQDDNGHGTHVTGIAAGAGNNGTGIAGICWDAQIIPVKVLDHSGDGTYGNVARGIIWAVDQGAEIINLSLGAAYESLTLQDAVNYALDNGVVLVAASGNAGVEGVYYPAAYQGVIAVGAVNQNNQHAYFSNYGPQVALAAPGQSIYSTNYGGGYSYKSGTSMAAPMVTGSIALISEVYGYSPASSLFILEDTAQDLGIPYKDELYGYGLIRLDRAMQWSVPTPTKKPNDNHPYSSNPNTGGVISPTISFTATPSLAILLTETSIRPVNPVVQTTDQSITLSITPTSTETKLIESTQKEADNEDSHYPWIGWLLIIFGISLYFVRKFIFRRQAG
jgi:thermitase